jgi:hypothetical protein
MNNDEMAKLAADQCGTTGASCKSISGVGICTYDDSAKELTSTEMSEDLVFDLDNYDLEGKRPGKPGKGKFCAICKKKCAKEDEEDVEKPGKGGKGKKKAFCGKCKKVCSGKGPKEEVLQQTVQVSERRSLRGSFLKK